MEGDKHHQIQFSQMKVIGIDFRSIISHHTDWPCVNT